MEIDRANIVTKFNTLIKNKSLSTQTENSIYKYSVSKSKEYKWDTDWSNYKLRRIYLNKAVSLYSNLNKSSYIKNITLLKRLKNGELDVTKIAFMTPMQIFPEHWKKMLARKDASEHYLYFKQLAPVTNKYYCSQCHKNRCTEYEVQLRSSDEPMSTLVECLECGYKWGF